MLLPSYDSLLLIFTFLVNAKPSAAVMVVPMNSPIGTKKRKRGWVFDALCISKILIIDKDFI